MDPAIILPLLLRYGPGAVDLAFHLEDLIAQKIASVSRSDWAGLKAKYATKMADQYLDEAGGAPKTS